MLCLLSQRLGNNVELISFLHRTGKQSKPSFCSIRQRERQKPCSFCSPNVNTMKAKGYRSDVHRCCFEPRLALVQENQVIMVIKKHSLSYNSTITVHWCRAMYDLLLYFEPCDALSAQIKIEIYSL